MEDIKARLIKELADRDLKQLNEVVNGLSFLEALVKLNGFDYDGEYECFCFHFGCLVGMIFRTHDGGLRIEDFFDIKLSKDEEPIAKLMGVVGLWKIMWLY